MTYAEFVARLVAVLQVDPATDDDFATYLPEIIQDAEAMIFRELDPIVARKQATITLTTASPTATGPADWLLGREARLTIGAASQRLQRADETFLTEYAPAAMSLGVPKYWAEVGFQTLAVAPTPDAPYAVTLLYTAQPAPLSATNTTTWLATWLPDLFFAAAMVCATGYQRNWGSQADDPKMALSWKGQYEGLLLSARRAEGRRKGEGVFDASQSPPPPTARAG